MRHSFNVHAAHNEYEAMIGPYKSIVDSAFDALFKKLKASNIHLNPADPSEFLVAAIHQAIKDSETS